MQTDNNRKKQLMNSKYKMRRLNQAVFLYLSILFTFSFSEQLKAQIVNVGEGSYTTQFPGTDQAGRNGFPGGTPFTVNAAANKPVPTNDWWSSKVQRNHSDNLFSYPYTLKTINNGLVVSYIPWGVIDDQQPIIIGVNGLNANAANVSDFSDWTVTMDWQNSSHHLEATAGIGMPFLYFEKAQNDIVEITVNEGSTTIDNETLIIKDAHYSADFAIYAPTGSAWVKTGNKYSSTLNEQNYWSMAFLPGSNNPSDAAEEYKRYAYVFPSNTTASWNFDEESSILKTDFETEVVIKEGQETNILQGLLPHQWANLSPESPDPNLATYPTVRGELKVVASNTFSTENTFYGILPTLPYVDYCSEGFNPQELTQKITSIENDGLAEWTDSYNEGQVMNRLVQTARIADLMGNVTSRDKIIETIRERLEDWLQVNENEVAFLFYYNTTWSALLGYPAGHGQDTNINDHHFHWGYFIHAAAFIEQYLPGWAAEWGPMIDLLIRDAASPDREDELFPFLRNFSPFAGHCWANGFASFPQGNDQESTSESMQFNSSLIHWGSVVGNDEIRDLGIYLYTTEQTAIEEYWFDVHERNFGPNQQYSLVSRIWGNSYDNGTFWTNDIAASYGIELYPIHGGSLYLGHQKSYIEKLWTEITENTGILNNEVNPNLWHDVFWEFQAFLDPETAIQLYDSNPNRNLKFGISDAQTYHWLHSMNALGQVDISVTSNHPLSAVFTKDGERTYVANNYSDEEINVAFSDGFEFLVPARTMITSKDAKVRGQLGASFDKAYPGGSVDLSVEVTGGTPTKIEFYDGSALLGESTDLNIPFTADNLTIGIHGFYARLYEGDNFSITNIANVTVGTQKPFLGDFLAIPGEIQPSDYDVYEGGNGQGISYNDSSLDNKGTVRPNEYVDVFTNPSEGNVIEYISSGEWLEYSVNVQASGIYSMDIRMACGNPSGGGPFHILMDQERVSDDIPVIITGDWNSYTTQTVTDIPLKKGEQILRIFFQNGEVNIGKIIFKYSSQLPYSQPIADAGEDLFVLSSQNNFTLNGTGSMDPQGNQISYEWSQIYGPTSVDFNNTNDVTPEITNIKEGVYLFELRVSNGFYFDTDEVQVIISEQSNIAPNVTITSPQNGVSALEGKTINITAAATDANGTIENVRFQSNGQEIGLITDSPYTIDWQFDVGEYEIIAIATDNEGASTSSESVNITIEEAPSCFGESYNGDFSFLFSEADNNPTLTFIPSQANIGTPTCILYYGTDPNQLPGYNVTANQPFTINASEGTLIHFYYTYSYPGEVERNNANNKDTYVIGNCVISNVNEIDENSIKIFPNPVADILHIQSREVLTQIEIFDTQGILVKTRETSTNQLDLDLEDLHAGIYIIRVKSTTGKTSTKKIIKN